MDPMDKMDRLNLQKMIQANDVKDCTSEIRDKRHSQKIRDQVTHMLTLKKKYSPPQCRQIPTSSTRC